MALAKSLPTSYGAPADHWTIGSMFIDRVSFRVDIQLRGFVSKQAEEEGMQPITTKSLSFQFTTESIEDEMREHLKKMGANIPVEITEEIQKNFYIVSTFGYGLVKTNSEFLDAEDA